MEIAAIYKIFEQYPKISTDSRKVAEGSIFFALHGDNFDGNRYAAQALLCGAEYAVVDNSEAIDTSMPAQLGRYILVDNTLETLQQLAAYHRRQLAIPVLAITGSNGKTTTKELIYRILAQKFDVSVTQGNLNNHIGVPLTLLSIDQSCQFAVVEMGASACGEIALLCDIAAPNFGIITNVGRAHLEGFGGEQGVRRGKGELFDYLAAHQGTAFYREDDKALCEMVAERNGLKTVEYCSNGEPLKNRLVGDYNKYNIAAAAAIGAYFGVSEPMIAQAVWSYEPDNNRSQRMVTANNTLIVDCYNANPSSMSASLTNFAREAVPTSLCNRMSSDSPDTPDIPDTASAAKEIKCEKWVIIGDMLELGEYSLSEHTNILRELNGSGISDVYVVGHNFCQAAAAIISDSNLSSTPAPTATQTTTQTSAPTTYRLHTYSCREELQKELEKHTPKDKFILIKGSRGIGLEKLIASL